IGIAQYQAMLGDAYAEVRRLAYQMQAVDKELRAQGRDARLALVRLYDHPNIQVRLEAAKCTLGIAPVAARETIKAIKESQRFPQAGDAGMTLRYLDEGIFKPD
ncbi:MAG: DUF2019 domain-containing protein, partial [Methylocella sp.]